jgi:small basic protein (TIGR04137 family)
LNHTRPKSSFDNAFIKKHCAAGALAVMCGRITGFNRIPYMSQHRSLRAASTSGAKRNVMKRFERIEILKRRGQWKIGDRVTGLRKTKADA